MERGRRTDGATTTSNGSRFVNLIHLESLPGDRFLASLQATPIGKNHSVGGSNHTRLCHTQRSSPWQPCVNQEKQRLRHVGILALPGGQDFLGPGGLPPPQQQFVIGQGLQGTWLFCLTRPNETRPTCQQANQDGHRKVCLPLPTPHRPTAPSS